jgi:hypothetical protein
MHTYTWDKLVKNSARLNPNTRGTKYPYTQKFELLGITPFKGTKSCLVKLQAWGRTQNALHQVSLLFSECEILSGEQNLSLWDYFKIEYKGEVYYVKKFNKMRNPLTFRCSCKDMYFSFAYPAYYFGNCFYGPAPKPYRRKTSNYPPRNPKNIVGCCKHIYNAWEYLQKAGLTVN